MQKLIYSVAFVMFLLVSQRTLAQSNFINHTLKQGESLSMLAKQYNTNVGDIMRMNGMHADTKLVYGSIIKISSNKKINTPTEVIKPATQQVSESITKANTHKILRGETLFSISKKYNVSVNDLKTWNHLTTNSANLGSILIVGNNTDPVTVSSDIKKQSVETPLQTPTQIIAEPEHNAEIKDTTAVYTQNITPKNNLQDSNTAQPKIETQNTVTDNDEPSTGFTNNGKGYFADIYKKTRKQQHATGICKTFKTASGWSDGKYYILADDINPGTIVKLTADNGNAVYAKVLWNMGNLKENEGVNFRISNATAAALSENTDSFNLNIYY